MTSEPVPAADRPWPAPGPDTGWWQGIGVDESALSRGSRRADGPRHRERRALPSAAATETTTVIPADPEPVPPAPLPPPIWEPAEATEGREWAVRTLRAMRPGRPGQLPRAASAARPGRKTGRRRGTRRPGVGLAALVLVGLLAAFFGWFSAAPLWLSLGHGTRGTATVVSCPVHGLAKRCADFTADGNGFVATRVTLLGSAAGLRTGATVPARMVSAAGGTAYVGDTTSRWAPSLLAVLLCGLLIAWLSGAFRLADRRSRWAAFGLSLAGPVLLTIGMLAAAW